jgi:hypothetical protein
MALALVGIATGMLVGGVLPALVAPLVKGLLPVPPRFGLYPAQLAIAGVFGMLTGVAAGKWVDRVGARWPMVLTSAGIAVSALLGLRPACGAFVVADCSAPLGLAAGRADCGGPQGCPGTSAAHCRSSFRLAGAGCHGAVPPRRPAAVASALHLHAGRYDQQDRASVSGSAV